MKKALIIASVVVSLVSLILAPALYFTNSTARCKFHCIGENKSKKGLNLNSVGVSPIWPEYARDSKIAFKLDENGGDINKDVEFHAKWSVINTVGKPVEFEVFNDGRVCCVWGPVGNYRLIVIVSSVNWSSRKIEFKEINEGFKIVDSITPDPDPGPDPPGPYPFSDASEKVIELWGPVKDDDKVGAAKVLSASYKKHGELALKGEYKDQNQLADATTSEFVYELGLNRFLKHRPASTRLREYMSTLIKDGRIHDKKMDEWGLLWIAISKGFDKLSGENKNAEEKTGSPVQRT